MSALHKGGGREKGKKVKDIYKRMKIESLI